MVLKPVDTAIIMVVGPCIDDTDFKSLEEAIAYNAAGMDISLIVEKTDGTSTVTAITLTTGGTSDWTHKDGGYYEVEVTAAQNAEEGIAYLRGVCTGVLPFESSRYDIVKANIYDSLIKGTDTLQTDVTALDGSGAALDDLADFATDGYNTATNKIAGVELVDTTTTNTDMVGTNNAALASGVDLTKIHGVALTETIDGYLATAFTKLFDVATPLLVASDVMRGTDSAALAATALTDTTWTDARAGYLDELAAANLPTDIADIPTVSEFNARTLASADYVITSDTIAGVTTVTNLTNAPTSGDLTATMKASVNTEVDTALSDIKLDHLINIAVDTDWGTTVHLDSVIGHMADVGTAATFDRTQESMEAIRDRGDAAWVTATGFSTHSAADVKTAIEAAGSHLALILADTGTDGVLLAATATSAQLVADAWDEILTGATHNIATSAGRRVREIGAFAIHSGTATAGSGFSITIAASASADDGVYNRNLIVLVDNTGAGQTRTIVDYDASSKICVVDREWRVSPDATTEYQIVPDDTPLTVDHGRARGGTATTITLRTYASDVDDTYLCNQIGIIAGPGRGQARLVGTYDGTSKIVTICGDDWVTTPTTDSIYVMMPYGTTCTSCLGDHALGLINTECDTALTDYDPPTRTEATSDKDAIITEVNANETKIDALQTDSTAVKAKTDNLPSGIGKNEALAKFDVFMVLSSDHVTGATGKTVTGTISKDGGAFAAITNVITEVSDGMYTIASGFTQAEMNADVVTLKFTADDCDTRIITIHTS